MLLFCYLLSIPVFLYPIRRYNTRLLSVPSNSFCSWWFARFRTLGGELGSCALRCWSAAVLPKRCVSPVAARSMRASTTAGSSKMRLVGRLASVPRHGCRWAAGPFQAPHGQKQSSKRKATEETEKRPPALSPACPQPFRSIRARARSVALGWEEGIIIAMAVGRLLAQLPNPTASTPPRSACVERGGTRTPRSSSTTSRAGLAADGGRPPLPGSRAPPAISLGDERMMASE